MPDTRRVPDAHRDPTMLNTNDHPPGRLQHLLARSRHGARAGPPTGRRRPLSSPMPSGPLATLVRDATRTGDLSAFAPSALALLFLSAGGLVIAMAVVPGAPNPLAAALVGAVAVGLGGFLLSRARRPHLPTLNAIVALGTVLVGVMIANTEAGRPEALAYVWIGLYCGVFFSRRAQIGQLALMTVSYATALVVRNGEAQDATTTIRFVLVVVGAVGIGLVWIGLLRKLIEALIVQQTNYGRTDSLTGLPNRSELRHRGGQVLQQGQPATILLVDLDDFKLVNDRWGHDAGDQALRTVARRLLRATGPDDLVARLGGDEFAVFQHGEERATATAERIVAALREPVRFRDELIPIEGSLGMAVAHEHEDIDELISDADLARHAATDSGLGWRRFQPELRADAHARRELVRDLREAWEQSQFSIRYQPIVGLDNMRTKAVEALVRWEHPEQGTVGPDRFIPVAEATGLIVPLGRWVLREACAQAATWPSAYAPTLTVNLAPRQLLDDDVVRDVYAAYTDAGLHPGRLVLEITESSVMTDPDLALQRLHELRHLGVGLAIDDFGTGYSSLEYLRRLPVTTLKLARTFILDMTESDDDAAFASKIIELAHTAGKLVVAEGIETEEQCQLLRGMACDLAQGYLFDRPLFAIDLQARLQRESDAAALSCAAPPVSAVGTPASGARPRIAPA